MGTRLHSKLMAGRILKKLVIGTPHTAENLLDIAKEEKTYVENEFKMQVCAMVTDNATNMASLRRCFLVGAF